MSQPPKSGGEIHSTETSKVTPERKAFAVKKRAGRERSCLERAAAGEQVDCGEIPNSGPGFPSLDLDDPPRKKERP